MSLHGLLPLYTNVKLWYVSCNLCVEIVKNKFMSSHVCHESWPTSQGNIIFYCNETQLFFIWYTIWAFGSTFGCRWIFVVDYYLVKGHVQFFFLCSLGWTLVSNVFSLFFFSFQVFDIAKMTINHKKDLSRFRHKQDMKKKEIPNINIPHLWEPTIQDWHDFIFFLFFF